MAASVPHTSASAGATVSPPAPAGREELAAVTSSRVAGGAVVHTDSWHSHAAQAPIAAVEAANGLGDVPGEEDLDELMALGSGEFDEDPFGHSPLAALTPLELAQEEFAMRYVVGPGQPGKPNPRPKRKQYPPVPVFSETPASSTALPFFRTPTAQVMRPDVLDGRLPSSFDVAPFKCFFDSVEVHLRPARWSGGSSDDEEEEPMPALIPADFGEGQAEP